MTNLKIKLPENFLDEEIRCDYKVSSEMKKIWAVELDLIAEFDRVCKKHNLKYFIDGGTLLGAVRHNGFIPWDDDIDVIMKRADYEKLCKISKDEFYEPYFFQTEETDFGSLRGHAQFRNSNTTGILKSEFDIHYRFNQGIFVDIFPFDNVPDNEQERNDFFKEIRHLKNKALNYVTINLVANHRSREYFSFKSLVKSVIKLFLWKLNIKNPYYKKMQHKAQKYNNKNVQFMAPVTFIPRKQNIYKISDYEKTTELQFEFLSLPAPENYEKILEQAYGNWKEFVIGTSVHDGVFFDPDKSYVEYMNTKQEEKHDKNTI